MRVEVTLGTRPLSTVLDALRAEAVQYNPYAERLLGGFVSIAPSPYELAVEIQEVAALGFPHGATMDSLLEAAAHRRLGPCPLEAALHLRLTWLDQPTGPRVTITSARPTPDELQPRGFYLRRDDSGLWLRGYVASDDWVFDPGELVALAADD